MGIRGKKNHNSSCSSSSYIGGAVRGRWLFDEIVVDSEVSDTRTILTPDCSKPTGVFSARDARR